MAIDTFRSPASSNIAGASYDSDAKQLRVQFQSGATWLYEDVDTHTWDDFKRAPSKGRYFIMAIRDLHAAEEV